MPKSLADLVPSVPTARPERAYRAVVGDGQKFVVEVQRLTEEHDEPHDQRRVARARARSATRRR
jgi:hypothetical protein